MRKQLLIISSIRNEIGQIISMKIKCILNFCSLQFHIHINRSKNLKIVIYRRSTNSAHLLSCYLKPCKMDQQPLTSVLSLHLINFFIPKIPKTDLGSSQIVESDGTLGIAQTNNVPHFYTYFMIQKFLLLLQGCLCGVEVACWVHMLKVSGSNPGQ